MSAHCGDWIQWSRITICAIHRAARSARSSSSPETASAWLNRLGAVHKHVLYRWPNWGAIRVGVPVRDRSHLRMLIGGSRLGHGIALDLSDVVRQACPFNMEAAVDRRDLPTDQKVLEQVSLGGVIRRGVRWRTSQNLCWFREALVCRISCSRRGGVPPHLDEKRRSRASEATKRLGPLARRTTHVFQRGSREAESSTRAESRPRHLRSPVGACRMRAVEREAGWTLGRSHYRRRRLILLQRRDGR
jgi:hypothetical protein